MVALRISTVVDDYVATPLPGGLECYQLVLPLVSSTVSVTQFTASTNAVLKIQRLSCSSHDQCDVDEHEGIIGKYIEDCHRVRHDNPHLFCLEKTLYC